MRFQITIPVAISAGEHRGSGVAHWIEDDRLLLRTRFTLGVGRPFGFALLLPANKERIIGLARVLEREAGTAERAPGWICEVERLSPEMRAALERFRASLRPEPRPEPPTASMRVVDEDSSEPDTALSESTVARTTDTSANTAPDPVDKFGRRALKGAVARSAVGRAQPTDDAGRGPGWLSELDQRLRASRLDDLPPPPPPGELRSPFSDAPMRLADEGAWHGDLRPLGADDPSTEVAKYPFDEDDPTSVAEFAEEEPSLGSFALVADTLIDEAEQAANWSAVQRERGAAPKAPEKAPPPKPPAEDARWSSPFDRIDPDDDPFADLVKPPDEDDMFSTPPADKPAPKAKPAPPPPPSAEDDWLASLLSGPAPATDAGAAAALSMAPPAIVRTSHEPPQPKGLFPGDFDAPADPPSGAGFLSFPADEPSEELIDDEAPPAPTGSGMSIVPRAPHGGAEGASFRYIAAQRMVEVSWRSATAFARDQRDQLENRVLRLNLSPGPRSGDKITVKLALPDGQVLAMPGEVIGEIDGACDVELNIPKPAQQKLRRVAQGG